MTAIRMSISKSLTVMVLIMNALGAAVAQDSSQVFEVASPFDLERDTNDCPVNASEVVRNLSPYFEAMKLGPEEAAACAELLDANMPDWHQREESKELVEPILGFLLGDGVARGMNRHADFINLLGHLQKIAPDWRLRQEVDDILEQAIIESVAQDPFVAEFWRDAIDEGYLGWQETERAESLLPEIYELAVTQQQRNDGLINDRPKMLLKELSWPSYAKLIFETRVIDTYGQFQGVRRLGQRDLRPIKLWRPHVHRRQPVARIVCLKGAPVGGQGQGALPGLLHQMPRNTAGGVATGGGGRAVGVVKHQMRVLAGVDHGELIKTHAAMPVRQSPRQRR